MGINALGQVDSVTTKELYFMPITASELRKFFSKQGTETRIGWHLLKGAIEVMYEPQSEDVITSIVCQ